MCVITRGYRPPRKKKAFKAAHTIWALSMATEPRRSCPRAESLVQRHHETPAKGLSFTHRSEGKSVGFLEPTEETSAGTTAWARNVLEGSPGKSEVPGQMWTVDKKPIAPRWKKLPRQEVSDLSTGGVTGYKKGRGLWGLFLHPPPWFPDQLILEPVSEVS
ncbi:unnamed protein product [Gadus morhua 'NCC']